MKILRTTGHYENTVALMRAHLRRSRAERILVVAINDPCALGALQAFRDAGREEHCAIVGHNASPEVHAELAVKNSRLIGSVGYFPERYGEGVIPLALDLLGGRPVPPATFVRHEMVTPANLRASTQPVRSGCDRTAEKQKARASFLRSLLEPVYDLWAYRGEGICAGIGVGVTVR